MPRCGPLRLPSFLQFLPCLPYYGRRQWLQWIGRISRPRAPIPPACRLLGEPIRFFVPRNTTMCVNPVESHPPCNIFECLDDPPHYILPRGLPRVPKSG